MKPVSLPFRISEQVRLQVVYNLGQKKDTVACELDPHSSSLAQDQWRNFQRPWYLSWVSPLKIGNVIYVYAFRVKTRQDRILQNTHRFLGSCWEEPGHFRDPDWNGASVSMSACGASASVGAVSKTVTLVPVCWVNCWRLTCCSSSVAHSSSCSLSCNRLVSCPRDLSTALVMFSSLRLCWQNLAPSPCSAVCSLRELY